MIEYVDPALKLEKAKEYMQYIFEHRTNVQKAFNMIRPFILELPIGELSEDDGETKFLKMMEDIIKNHDLSKYSDEEFEPYRKKFYPIVPEETDEDEFRTAVEHHYQENAHHPEHFGASMDMPVEHIIEMICDLMAVSMVKGGNPCDFWDSKSESTPMAPESKAIANKMFAIVRRKLFEGNV